MHAILTYLEEKKETKKERKLNKSLKDGRMEPVEFLIELEEARVLLDKTKVNVQKEAKLQNRGKLLLLISISGTREAEKKEPTREEKQSGRMKG